MRLRNVSPCYPANNLRNVTFVDLVLCNQCIQVEALTKFLSNLDHLWLREFCEAVRLATRLAVFCHFIRHIVGLGAKKQMIGVHTAAIVALVTNIQVFWGGTAMKYVGDPVSGHLFAAPMRSAVAFWTNWPLPLPANTWIALVNVFPKFPGIGLAGIVSGRKTYRFAFDPSALRLVLCRYPGLLSTTTLAIAVGDFVRGFVRGMLRHVNASLLGVGRATGCLSQRRGVSIGLSSVFYHKVAI